MRSYYAREKKRFEQEWAKLRREYAEAGMDDESIEQMYAFDLESFRSQRVYEAHTQPLPSEYLTDDGQGHSTLFQKFKRSMTSFSESDFFGPYGWVETVEDQRLAACLKQLSREDLELLTRSAIDGYTQPEIARSIGCSQSVISRKLKRIKKFLR